jgi:hypothetical protein
LAALTLLTGRFGEDGEKRKDTLMTSNWLSLVGVGGGVSGAWRAGAVTAVGILLGMSVESIIRGRIGQLTR